MFPLESRFLIVDDSIAMRIAVMNALREMGYSKFIEAGDGIVAEELLQAGNEVDVILSDHLMPRCTGLGLLEKLGTNPKYARIPFIVFTADWEKSVVLRALELGAVGFIVKPVLPEQLKAKLASTYARLKALRGF